MDSDILFYLRKKTISKITVVENDEEIESHMHQERAVVVAHFRSNQSLKYRYFEDAVKDMDDVDCLCGFGENKMSEPVDSLTVTSTEGRVSTFDGKWNVEELKRFIATNALPLVVPYSSYWNRFIFSGDHGIREELVYMVEDEAMLYDESVNGVLKSVAKDHVGEFIAIIMPYDVNNMIEYFGFSQEDLPILFYVVFVRRADAVGGYGRDAAQEVCVLRRAGVRGRDAVCEGRAWGRIVPLPEVGAGVRVP